MGSHTLEICSSFPFHCPDRAKMLHLPAGENILASWARKVLPAAAFSQAGRWFERCEGYQVVVSYLHAAPRVNWLT